MRDFSGEHMKWIDVREKLPKIKRGSTTVIIYSPHGHANARLQGSYFYIPKGKGRPGKFGWANVTHWMPMPNPPVKDEVIEAYRRKCTQELEEDET
jgi:hypothetical protein